MGLVLDPRSSSWGCSCFMCFKEISNGMEVEDTPVAAIPECTNDSNDSMAVLFLKLLRRYLKVEEPGGVHGFGDGAAGEASSLVGPIGDEASPVSDVLPLCIGCGAIARKFLELYQLLDFVRLEADAVVREIHRVMVAAEVGNKNKDLVLQNSQRVRDESGEGSGGDGDLVTSSERLMRLRKQLIEKCCRLGETTMPRVVLQQLDIKNYSTKMKKNVHLRQTTRTTADSCPQVLPERKSEVKAREIIEYQNSEPNLVTAAPPPPPPRSGGGISFKKLVNGRYECSLCRKRLKSNKSIRRHERSHKTEKSFKCPHCDKAFQHPSGVRSHKYWAHRSNIFAQHKDPTKFTSAQFERLVANLFHSIPVPEEIRPRRGALYRCSFCDCSPMSHKENVHNHWIRLHKDQLVPKLLELQQSTTVEEIEEDMLVVDPPAGEPSPTSVSPAVQEGKDHKISFKKLPNGRYQCSSCERTLVRHSIWAHRISHVAGDSFKCHICAKLFLHQSNLEEHKYRDHRSSFFAQHKEPSLGWEQFEGLIGRLFASIEVPKLREGAWQCTFCETISLNDKGRVRNHWIRQHMDELVPRLMELQKNIRESQNSSSSSSSSPSENGTSANRNNLGMRDEDADPPHSSSVSICENSDLDEEMCTIEPPPASSEPNLVITNVTSSAARHQAIDDDNENDDDDKRFKCDTCVDSFRDRTTLRNHKLWKHRSSFFAAHKDPRLSSEQFEGAIVALFEGIPVPRIRKEVFICVLCSDCPQMTMKKKGLVQNHSIQRHMDHLVPRLLELQTKILATQTQQQQDSSAFGTGNLSSPATNVDNDQHDLKGNEEGQLEEEEEPNLVITNIKSVVDQDGGQAQEQIMISFKKLASGRYQCSFCHKSVKNKSCTWGHRASHVADKSFQCSICAQSFQSQKNLEVHKLWKHRSLFFAKHKDAKLTSGQFEALIVTLFNGLHIPRVPSNGAYKYYKCSFCEIAAPMSSKGRVQNHWIRTHMEELLVPRLVELQRNILLKKPKGSRRMIAPSQLPSTLLRSHQSQLLSGYSASAFQEHGKQEVEAMEWDQEEGELYYESRNICNKIQEAEARADLAENCGAQEETTNKFLGNGGDIMILGI